MHGHIHATLMHWALGLTVLTPKAATILTSSMLTDHGRIHITPYKVVSNTSGACMQKLSNGKAFILSEFSFFIHKCEAGSSEEF